MAIKTFPIKAALFSVYDKTGIKEIACILHDMGYTLLATGGTHTTLTDLQIPVISIEEYTQYPELFDGRVKTLHPKVHAGILARRNQKSDIQQMNVHDIYSIEIVVANLYPFESTVLTPNTTISQAIEQIDIGGVTLIRAAAKNHAHTTVLTSPQDYAKAIEIFSNPNTKKHIMNKFRLRMASKAFSYTAYYEAVIAGYMSEQIEHSDSTHTSDHVFTDTKVLPLKKIDVLRYGENPHQHAALYTQSWPPSSSGAITQAKQLSGKQLSFNNIRDADTAVQIASEFSKPVAVGVKHSNPCGVAIGNTVLSAWKGCYNADPVSIFGGIVAFNRTVDEHTAKEMANIFLEVIIAPNFTKKALEILTKKSNLRLLVLPIELSNQKGMQDVSVTGGILYQEYDTATISEKDCTVVTKNKPTASQYKDLLFAWKVCKYVKSNAIVVARKGMVLGVGAGQMNRVGAAKIALQAATSNKNIQHTTGNTVLASDAFFPMPDTVTLAAKYGITAIIQPGGSIRDNDSIDVCDAQNIAMVFTGTRHFLH